MPLHLVGRHGDAVLSRGEVALAELSGLPLVLPARPHLLRARLVVLAESPRRPHTRATREVCRLVCELADEAGGG